MKTIIVIFLFVFSLNAQKNICKVDDRIMYGIASIERHSDMPIGYPFLISINLKNDQSLAHEDNEIKEYFLDKRTIDCESEKNCVAVLNKLILKNITNLDCGPFQINYMYWAMPKKEYFDVQKSYNKACSIIMSHNKNKWSWKNIAKYHSKNKEQNDRYKSVLLTKVKNTYRKD